MVEMRVEPLSYMLLNGLSDLAFQAWTELESSKDDAKYNVNWEAYQNMEAKGELRFISLRKDENLIGYAVITLQNDVHQAELDTAILYDIYIKPAKRGYAATFVRFIEQLLSQIGRKRLIAAEKMDASTPNEAGKFFAAMGFVPMELRWSKTIH